MDIITSHTNADFDALASMVAAKKLYPEATIAVPDRRKRTCVIFSGVRVLRRRDGTAQERRYRNCNEAHHR
jgi:hypothetical protein